MADDEDRASIVARMIEEGLTEAEADDVLTRALAYSYERHDLASRPARTVRTPADLAGLRPKTLAILAAEMRDDIEQAEDDWFDFATKEPKRVQDALSALGSEISEYLATLWPR
jgi:hypothetical protein